MRTNYINQKLFTGTLIAFLLCLLQGCKNQQYIVVSTIKGKVVTSSDKAPISGAKIYVDKYAFNAFDTVQTNSDGRFEIKGIKVKDYGNLKLQRKVSYLLSIEKAGFKKQIIDIRDFKSIKDTIDLGMIYMDTLLTEQNDNLVGNVYVADPSAKYADQIQAIRIDKVHERTLRTKYKIAAEQFLDADFLWHESIGMWLSSKPLTYGSHAQHKSRAKLFIKENELELQLEDKLERIIYRKRYNMPIDLKTNRDPYFAEDGFSIEKPFEILISDMVRSSDATALKNFKDVQVRISDIAAKKISIELYVTNSNSEDHSVGWLEYYPYENKLQDITYDPDNPEILDFDTNILKTVNFEYVFGDKNE